MRSIDRLKQIEQQEYREETRIVERACALIGIVLIAVLGSARWGFGGVTTAPSGWTDVTPSNDTRQVYVSSSTGADTNAGTQAAPVKTLAKAYTLLRDGSPDWLLLKRGDTFDEPMGVVVPGVAWRQWRLSGRSADEPMMIGAYGTGARPVVTGGGQIVFQLGAAAGLRNLVVVGIELRPPEAGTTQAGVQALTLGKSIIFEDCYVHDFQTNMSIQGPVGVAAGLTDVRIRRCVIADAHGKTDANMRHGLFATRIDGLLVEECYFDHNGWGGIDQPDMFSQGMYLTASSHVTVRRNVIRDSACNGVKIGGEAQVAITGVSVTDNLFVDGGHGLIVGSGLDGGLSDVTVAGNVFYNLGTHPISGQAASMAVTLWSGANMGVTGNLFLNKPAGGTSALVYLYDTRGYQNVKVGGNTAVNWNGGKVQLAGANYNGVSISGNVLADAAYQSQLVYFTKGNPAGVTFAGNHYFSARAKPFRSDVPSYSEMTFAGWQSFTGETGKFHRPTLREASTLETYAASVSAGSFAEVCATMRQQSRAGGWRFTAAPIIDYLREGYIVTGYEDDPPPPPPPATVTVTLSIGGKSVVVIVPKQSPLCFTVSSPGYTTASGQIAE